MRNNWSSASSLLLLITMSFVTSISNGQECPKLKDGKYKVKFKKQSNTSMEYILLIKQDRFKQFSGGKEINGKIELNEDCMLRLDYLVKWDTTNNVQKLLGQSDKPFFKFEKTTGKRIRFRLTGYAGPHTTAGEGKFIKDD